MTVLTKHKTNSSIQKKTSFFRGVQQELKKISWTTKEELVTCTRVVIGTTFLSGMGIYLADLMVRSGLEGLRLMIRYIGG